MIDRNEFEEQFNRYAPEFLQELRKFDPTGGRIGGNIPWFAAITQVLGAIGLYYSSKTIETYSLWLKRLTIALVILTFTLAVLTALLLLRPFTTVS